MRPYQFGAILGFGLSLLLIGCSTQATIRDIPHAKKKVILFEDFDNNAPESIRAEFSGLSRAIPSEVQNDFTNFGLFRPVSEENRKKALREVAMQHTGLVVESDGKALAQLSGAEWLLTGEFTILGQTIRIVARVVHVPTGETRASTSVGGSLEQLLHPPKESLLKQTSVRLLSKFDIDPTDQEIRILTQNSETDNIRALINNYEGEILLEKKEREIVRADAQGTRLNESAVRDYTDKAKQKFRRALSEDPTYRRARKNLRRLTGALPAAI